MTSFWDGYFDFPLKIWYIFFNISKHLWPQNICFSQKIEEPRRTSPYLLWGSQTGNFRVDSFYLFSFSFFYLFFFFVQIKKMKKLKTIVQIYMFMSFHLNKMLFTNTTSWNMDSLVMNITQKYFYFFRILRYKLTKYILFCCFKNFKWFQ